MKSMNRIRISIKLAFVFFLLNLGSTSYSFGQVKTDSIVLKDINWDKVSPAGMKELTIPSAGSLLQGLLYKPNGPGLHPTLIMLHGYPGNEKNLDLAQYIRSQGWNVIYFDYRGSWGSQGKFSLLNCVDDVKNVASYCLRHYDSLQVDTSRISLFGHSMGGWVGLKAMQAIPYIKKGFFLSAWDIYKDFKNINDTLNLEEQSRIIAGEYFVLNTPVRDIFEPVVFHPDDYKLTINFRDTAAFRSKQVFMLDDNQKNIQLAKNYQDHLSPVQFGYESWNTDHSFTNKRVSLMIEVMNFLVL
jgi:pimeloyl-ACP methyl ester carboxylesterase